MPPGRICPAIRRTVSETLVTLGDTHAAADDPDLARTAWHRAMVMLEELGLPTAALRSKLVPARDAPIMRSA